MAASSEAQARWAQDAKAMIGQLVGQKYRIEKILGRGGMGTIYRAEQQPLGRKVALKVLHSTLGGGDFDPEFQKRFLLEAAVLAGLQHPNIVVLHDYGTFEDDTGACYMVMELLQGQTITEQLFDGPFEPFRALRIAREIARALRAAHGQGVVHRDLKPANVMLCPTPEGEVVKVLDFGLVKVMRDDTEELTAEGRFLGSPRYMSPEQIQRFDMDGRSDLYSLGVILYRMVCGREPFVADQAFLTLMAHLQDAYPPIAELTGVEVPEQVEAVIEKLLQKDPDDRYASADELIAAIDRLSPGSSNEPLPSGAAPIDADAPPRVRVIDSGELASLPPPPPSGSGSVPVITQPEAAPVEPPAAPERWKLVAAIAFLCAVAIAGAFFATRFFATPPAPHVTVVDATSDETESVPEIVPPDDVPPPVVARPFTLHLRSDPSGAQVSRDGEDLGQTPLDLELDAAALEEHPVTFTLRLRGRAPHVFTQGPSEEDVTVEGSLPRIATGRRRRSDSPAGGADLSIKTSR